MKWERGEREAITLEEAVAEAHTTAERLRRFVRACRRLDDFETRAQPRGNWHDELLVEQVFKIYADHNGTARDDPSIAYRADAMFYFAANVAWDHANRGNCGRLSEKLRAAKIHLKKLHSQFGNAAPREAMERALDKIPRGLHEFDTAWLEVAFQSAGLSEPNTSQYIAAIDSVLTQRRLRGPRRIAGAREARELMVSDYLWLTGRAKPSWTNDLGLIRGEFVDFQKSIFMCVGLPRPSDDLLRARTRTRTKT